MTKNLSYITVTLEICLEQTGWKQLMEDLKSNAMVINSVEAAKDNEDLHFRKGQLSIIANLLNLEAQIDATEAEALKEDEVEEAA